MTDPRLALDELTDQLEQAAAQLRGGELAAERAAAVIDDCAQLAARAASELEREARAVDAPPGQDSLL